MAAGAIWQRELTVTQNQDFQISLGYATPAAGLIVQLFAATPYDFTGAYAYMSICETATTVDDGGSPLLQLSTTVPGGFSFFGGLAFAYATVEGVSCGQIVITLTSAQTAALPVGKWYFDILVVQSGNQEYYAAGPFIVLPTVSRAAHS